MSQAHRIARTVANVVTDSRYIAADAWQSIRFGVASAAQRAS